MSSKLWIVCILVFLVLQCSEKEYGFITLENASGKTISDAKITVCRQEFKHNNIPAKSNVSYQYKIGPDSHYILEIIFSDKTSKKYELGYVTTGFCYNDTLIVYSDSCSFARAKDMTCK